MARSSSRVPRPAPIAQDTYSTGSLLTPYWAEGVALAPDARQIGAPAMSLTFPRSCRQLLRFTSLPLRASAVSQQEQLSVLGCTRGSWHEVTTFTRNASSSSSGSDGDRWRYLASRGEQLNPCNSPLHPAAKAGLSPKADEVLCVQEAYTPKSICFGCGHAHPDGLHLKSTRIKGGLEAVITIPDRYCAFPGVVNGGIVTTLVDCHGNWSAAIALMDKSCLPRPPLTLCSSIFLSYKEPTPPNTPLVIRSKIVNIKEKYEPGYDQATVEVDVNVYEKAEEGGVDKLLVSGTVLCKRQGALREL